VAEPAKAFLPFQQHEKHKKKEQHRPTNVPPFFASSATASETNNDNRHSFSSNLLFLAEAAQIAGTPKGHQ
jgi:hypothetical protein